MHASNIGAHDKMTEHAPAVAAIPAEPHSANQRLLIVDEYALSRTVLLIAFRLRGYVCTGVGSAEDALASVETFAPSVILLEWDFRDGTGRGLSNRLRTRSRSCGRSLVVVVVSVTNERPEFRLHDSADEYLTKPAHADVIERAFERHLRARQ